jgi:uncharacterized protein
MKIPINQIDPETLIAIIESFILKEGTDYGSIEASLEDKIEQVKLQLINGTAILVYSELYETVNIVPADQYQSAGEY